MLFFTRGVEDKDNTKDVWFYDLRTNMENFNKTNTLKEIHLLIKNIYYMFLTLNKMK